MAEKRPTPNPGEPVPAPAAKADSRSPDNLTDLFLGPDGESQDDAPTIISKAPPQPARLDEAVAGSLRGRTLAHFELIEPIGVGGMAAVIRARDLQLDRSVALKILPPEMANDPENIRRFHQEARAAAKLDHENIARVFFCGEDQRLHFIAFEFVEGDNLRVLLERRGRLPVAEAVHYLLQVATGLAHASARGVVHRDIKPSNIIISPNGRAKLVDMGLARTRERHTDHALTQSGVTLGTFDYLSPEQALEPRDADVRSDIYSLGCTFYHMLTGQAPVPEGTAAKKLHHHQHVAPIDPRQLNAAIPDDVAAILARMMAKDPKDRYQRAEHLVQHLIQVARHLGPAPEAPDGVLFVDAPLPRPPRKRPALMAALAVLALGALLAVLSLAPTARERTAGVQAGQPRPDGGTRDRGSSDTAITKPTPVPPRNRGLVVVSTPAEWAQALARKPPVRRIQLKNSLDLTPGVSGAPTHPLVFWGEREQSLVIESLNAQPPCTIRITQAPRTEDMSSWTGFTVAGGTVTFKNLRFEVTGKVPDLALTALAVTRGKLILERCTFTLPDYSLSPRSPTDRPLPVAAVAVEESHYQPELLLKQCYFERGPSAVVLNSPAKVAATDCAFGPHTVLFHLRSGKTTRANTSLHLAGCSALVVAGPVFRLDNGSGCALVVSHSIFSRPSGGSDSDFIFQTDSLERNRICYTGKRNCYHNLNAFWKRCSGAEDRSFPVMTWNWTEFRSELERMQPQKGKDEGSEVLDESTNPWRYPQPLDVLASQQEQAFQLRTDLPQLRQQNRLTMIGVLQAADGNPLYRRVGPLPDRKVSPVVRKGVPRIKVVDADAPSGRGVYRNLAAAIAEAEPGDEIQIRSREPVKIGPIRLNKAAVNLTIKPTPDYPPERRPVLTLDEDPEKRAALFRLHDGKVVFEGLEFQLKPNKAEFEFQTVVEMIGKGHCVFKQCVLTLLEPDQEQVRVRPSVVRLTDPGEAMKMAPQSTRSAPEVRFQDCLVRGRGDLVAVLPSRPFDLEVNNSLVALDGSVLHVDGTAKDPPPASASTGNNNQVVRLINVTTYLSEHLLYLRAKNGKGLVPTVVQKAADNLFVAAGIRPLIQFDGLDSREQLERLISWEDSKHNAYVGFEKMLDSPRQQYDQDEWQNNSKNVHDEKPHFAKGKFDLDHPLSQAVPIDFKAVKADDPKMELPTYGANLDKLPPFPAAELPESE